MRVGGQCRDHTPVGDVAQGVEHVEHDEADDKQYDEPGGVHIDQAEHAGVDHYEQQGGDQAAKELPRAETAPFGGGVVHDVAQQRINENLRDTDDDDKAGDNADQFGCDAFFDAGEQAAGHVYDEVGAQCVVERGLAEVAECVCHTLADFATMGTAVGEGLFISHDFFSLEDL